MTRQPTVSVVIPVLNEAEHIDACLDSVDAQTYDGILEVLVVDGGSSDSTRALAARHHRARVVHNPRRIQAAAMNIALAAVCGEVVVRVDGHCRLAPGYVEGCVRALETTGAAMVGGSMTPLDGRGWQARGIAAAMRSRFAVGTARFHRPGATGWVDTVYLGAYRTSTARMVGGYREDVGVNEDYEFATRLRPHGGIWLDAGIRSWYTPRGDLRRLARQFHRYGLSRAATVRLHPGSLRPRQVAAPLLLLGLASPLRRQVAVAYATLVGAAAVHGAKGDAAVAAGLAAAMPVMHVSWALGFFQGCVSGAASTPSRSRRTAIDVTAEAA